MILRLISRWLLLLCFTFLLAFINANGQEKPTFKDFIRNSVADKKEIDVFLNDKFTWAKFDPVLGYTLNNFMPKDGVDTSVTISTVQNNGARTSFMYSDKPCRINTYGNSFTQCHQVSDGETWQEYLAAHLGEPIRNFGMGGYGAYQSYRRMLREENTKIKAEYIIYYIWGDDHTRSLLRCRYLTFKHWTKTMNEREGVGKMFHNNFWANVEMDMQTGVIREYDNRISKASDLYKMTDPVWVYDNVKDDLALQMLVFVNNQTRDFDTAKLKKLAGYLHVQFEPETSADPRAEVKKLLMKYSFAATEFVLNKAKNFAQQNNKKLMIVLLDPALLKEMEVKEGRYDQQIVNYLQQNNFNYFDMNLVHIEDYRKNFKVSFEEYLKRYFIGHYSPAGNHFFAFSIKPRIVKWLDPKPITYKNGQQEMINFKDYLQR